MCSCRVVNWISRLLISPTPSPGHRQVTFGQRYEKYVGQSTLDKLIELASHQSISSSLYSSVPDGSEGNVYMVELILENGFRVLLRYCSA